MYFTILKIMSYDSSIVYIFLIFSFWLFFSSFVFTIFQNTSLWLIVKGVRFDGKSFLKGLGFLLFTFIFGIALFNSGALVFLSVVPMAMFGILYFAALLFTPIIFGGIIRKYMFFREDYLNLYNVLYAGGFIFVLMFLPYVISYFLVNLLAIYVSGLLLEYINLKYFS
jgi:hypothetical protein